FDRNCQYPGWLPSYGGLCRRAGLDGSLQFAGRPDVGWHGESVCCRRGSQYDSKDRSDGWLRKHDRWRIGRADGVGATATFYFPTGITADASGNLYIADNFNHAIRKLTLATDSVSTVAGAAPEPGKTDAVGSAARFSAPSSACADGLGNLY